MNKLASKVGPRTLHVPSGKEMDVFDAALRYRSEAHPVIILAGKEYGSGSSRDWAAKGPALLGVRAVVAESFERIHRSNLIGIGSSMDGEKCNRERESDLPRVKGWELFRWSSSRARTQDHLV